MTMLYVDAVGWYLSKQNFVQTDAPYPLGACPRIGNLLRNHWTWPVSPLIFVKYAYIRLKLVKKLTQTSFWAVDYFFLSSGTI